VFFSKAALVTFGGAYAVLPYVAQQAVETHGWLSHAQMMSRTRPGRDDARPAHHGPAVRGLRGRLAASGHFLTPLGGATLGAAITTWTTFLPCFLFVFLGAPYIDKLGEQPRLSAALTAITAAVVGVILNLGVKFAIHAMWPDPGRVFDPFIAVVAVAAFVAMVRFKVGLMPVIGVCALLGLGLGWRWGLGM
jgi:chromate transporter